MSMATMDAERSVVQTEPRPATVSDTGAPLISVVVLNYNGAKWLERCLTSLRQQTILGRIEVIVADNLSADGSDRLAEQLLAGWPNGRFVQNGANLGFCEGNNRGAAGATGKFLLFLNNDAWLEPACLEILLRETENARADVATPLVMNYDDDSFQSLGAAGFDLFGLPTSRLPHTDTREVLMPEGCAYLIRRELFDRVGKFDAEFFMFADEYDLSWRAWVAGGRAVAVPAARLHHRGAANVNPKGGGTVVEFRTSDSKRFYTNRNSLLVLLKSAHHVLLLLAVLQIGLLAAESVVALFLVRRWSFVRRSFFGALADCWRLRHHVLAERRRLRGFRRRGDLWMLRFFRWRLNRWDELLRIRQLGVPRVTKG
jgi:N-acetylglucosaminyl-diphospho-decaprenol L-rhamnosyltransferase